MPPGLQRQQCSNHPDRYGHALCMACRKTLCQECATVWDGINYCASCLGKVRKKASSGSAAPVGALVLLVAIALFLFAPYAMVWGASMLFRITM